MITSIIREADLYYTKSQIGQALQTLREDDIMKEIRVHARAGQGAITTANLLGSAIFAEGRYALAFPHFGAARMGAPMNAFIRMDDSEIRLRTQIDKPNYILVVDSTLMRGFDVFSGLKDGGIALVNEKEGVSMPSVDNAKVYSVPANEIAMEIIGRPLGNTTLLGAFEDLNISRKNIHRH
jgi:pyruvate ferredoxin oxidoreductase gamma subunit